MKKNPFSSRVILMLPLLIIAQLCYGFNGVPQVLMSTVLGQAGIPSSQIDAQSVKGLESIAPPTIPQANNEAPQTPEDPPLPDATGSEAKLAEKFNAIILVGSEDKVKKEGFKSLSGLSDNIDNIVFHGVTPPDAEGLRDTIRPFLQGPVTELRINELVKEVILYYRANDRPLVDVYRPVHAMTNNNFQLVVIESVINEIRIEGNEYFDADMLASKMTVGKGDSIISTQVEEDVAWLNKNPFRVVELIYEEGEEPGTTDVVLEVTDKLPVRGTFGFNDTGNNLTAYERYTAGIMWGNAFGRDDTLNYGYTTSGHSSVLKAHSISYTTITPDRNTLTLIGSYADSGAEFPASLSSLDIEGLSWSLGLRYTIPWRAEETFSDVWTLGFDFKRSDNAILQNQVLSTTPTVTDVSQFVAGYNITFPQEKGAIMLGATGTYSPGIIGGHNTAEKFAAAGAGDPEYAYIKFTGAYIRQLPWYDLTLNSRAELQLASDTLSGGEKYGIGGSTSVRGYDNREANGDEGYLLSFEVRSAPYKLSDYVKWKWLQDDNLQFLAFAEYGGAHVNNAAVGTDPNINMFGIGPGLRYNIATNLIMTFDYGWQLKDSGVASLTRNERNSRAHFSLTLSY